MNEPAPPRPFRRPAPPDRGRLRRQRGRRRRRRPRRPAGCAGRPVPPRRRGSPRDARPPSRRAPSGRLLRLPPQPRGGLARRGRDADDPCRIARPGARRSGRGRAPGPDRRRLAPPRRRRPRPAAASPRSSSTAPRCRSRWRHGYAGRRRPPTRTATRSASTARRSRWQHSPGPKRSPPSAAPPSMSSPSPCRRPRSRARPTPGPEDPFAPLELAVDRVDEKVDSHAHLLVGQAAPNLAAAAAKADLLVVGTQVHKPFEAALLGSVTDDLVAGAECPVVALPVRSRPPHERGPDPDGGPAPAAKDAPA